ncbi:hypothetical protein [Aestuariispira insulae]|uniref:hypothetical protein n=1 Tax=Aestuariispira insulae TaxID=1461337 RepID=UPI0011C04CDE|nr:hypothetical protein [Aestuariispira insulae]
MWLLVAAGLVLSAFSVGQAGPVDLEPMAQIMEDCVECSDGAATDCERHCASGPMQMQWLEPVLVEPMPLWVAAGDVIDRLVGLTTLPKLEPPKTLS